MLMKSMFLAVVLLLSVGHAHAADAPSLPAPWTQIGITVGMPYAQAKALLIKAGWLASAPDNEARPFLPRIPKWIAGRAGTRSARQVSAERTRLMGWY